MNYPLLYFRFELQESAVDNNEIKYGSSGFRGTEHFRENKYVIIK